MIYLVSTIYRSAIHIKNMRYFRDKAALKAWFAEQRASGKIRSFGGTAAFYSPDGQTLDGEIAVWEVHDDGTPATRMKKLP